MIFQKYSRHILGLSDTDLEQFVRDWVSEKTPKYFEVKRFTGSGDRGRDVVGFLSDLRHEGKWDNYQCKQYASTLPTSTALHEIGKILYYAYSGDFSAPNKYYFVAPRGVNRNLEKLIYNPTKFRDELILKWDQNCAKSIIENRTIPLTVGLRTYLEAFDYSKIDRWKLDDFIGDQHIKPVLFKWFGEDPGPAPKGSIPSDIQAIEQKYISKLVSAYGQREGVTFGEMSALSRHPSHLSHLNRQRERFYDAESFRRFYRDNTNQNVIVDFENEILHGVIDVCEATHNDSLDRVNAVMTQAATLTPSGILAVHAAIPVKQGICHLFANNDQLNW